MDPSENACVEILRPKTVPVGLVALGIVVQVTEIQIKLQITGGIVCLVDRFNISRSYTKLVEKFNQNPDQDADQPPKLTDIFQRGEKYICKIIDRRPRKGYAEAEDIVASLDPSTIQEDNVAKSYLSIAQVPLQCAVNSVEDHGYQMDVGFTGLTGFMPFEEAEQYCRDRCRNKKFSVGQVIRCCLKSYLAPDSEMRIVKLALNDEDMNNSHFTSEKVEQNILNVQSFLPGTQSFLTVMKIVKNGLIVNFANEFSGFVNLYHLKEEWHAPKKDYKVSDQFSCTVLYFNKITKVFALSIRPRDKYEASLTHFIKNYHVGQVIKKAKVAYIDGTRSVNFKVENRHRALANVKDALDSDTGTMTADEISSALDEMYPDDSTHSARIKSINLADLIIVLSLKTEFLELPFVSVEELKPGDYLEATIKKCVKEGVIVSFGLNLRAIILNTDLEDYISTKSLKKYPVGKKIKCRVLKLDFSKHPPRVYLTNKTPLMDRKLTLVKDFNKSLKGKSTYATIVKLKPDGLIVELFNNVKGYVPKRFLSSASIKNVNDMFQVGQVIHCSIYRVNPNRPSLLLGVLPFEDILKLKSQLKIEKSKKKTLKKLALQDKKLEGKVMNSKLKVKDISDQDKCTKIKSQKVKNIIRKTHDSADEVEWDSDDSIVEINPPDKTNNLKRNAPTNTSGDKPTALKRFKFLPVESGINWSVKYNTEPQPQVDGDESEDEDEESHADSNNSDSSLENEQDLTNKQPVIKSRRQRSEEAKLREEKLRQDENRLVDTDRPPQSIPDFERLVLKAPNFAESWIKYSKFFLDNIETEKARIVCRRALRTMCFGSDKEKLKIWLHMIKIEARYGGSEQLKAIMEEAAQVNDKMELYQGSIKVLINCGNLDEVERLHQLMIKVDRRSVNVWYALCHFFMEHRKDPEKARNLYDKACKNFTGTEEAYLRSRLGQLEFRFGDVERGKTMFETLLSQYPKRTDFWSVYEAMVKKFGSRQGDEQHIQEQNEVLLKRIAENLLSVK